MTYDEISSLIADESNDIVYLADPITYELLYLNRAAQELLGVAREDQWKGKHCYQMLQNLENPCPFCTNHLLTSDKFYVWNHYNETFQKYFTVKDKLVLVDGRPTRLELASDTTEREEQALALRQKLEEEETLLSCIRTLNSSMDTDKAIHRLLEIVGGYYDAQRAYIFEISYKEDEFSNTYEWCLAGVEPQINNLKNLPIGAMDRWMEQFLEKGEFFITALGRELEEDTMEFQILDAQGINSLIAAPLVEEGRIVGFLGVDNPSINTERMELLRSVTTFVINDINKRKLMEQLTNLSFKDTLTGAYNRNYYMKMLEGLQKQLPAAIGIIYLDINGLKLVNDTYGHKHGDQMIRHTGKILGKLFGDYVYRIGGDEFVVLCINTEEKEFYEKEKQLRMLAQNDGEFKVSIGACWTSDCGDITKQVTRVNDLMYSDKHKFYGMRLENMGNYHAGISRRLVCDLAEGKFEVRIQPKNCPDTKADPCLEAVVRMKKENGESEDAEQFCPVYEKEGIIRHIDFYVFTRVCETLKQQKAEGERILPVAVTVSCLTVLEHDIVEKLLEVCKQHEVEAGRISIEIKDRLGMIEEADRYLLLRRLKVAGFMVKVGMTEEGKEN